MTPDDNAAKLVEVWEASSEKDTGPLRSLLDPEVTYEDEILPDHAGQTYRGHEGLARAWKDFTEPWASFEGEIEWARAFGDEVVTCHLIRMRGRGSGLASTVRYAYLWRFQDGKVVHVRSYRDPSQALEAAGAPAGLREPL